VSKGSIAIICLREFCRFLLTSGSVLGDYSKWPFVGLPITVAGSSLSRSIPAEKDMVDLSFLMIFMFVSQQAGASSAGSCSHRRLVARKRCASRPRVKRERHP
jgi:hypothetical protein